MNFIASGVCRPLIGKTGQFSLLSSESVLKCSAAVPLLPLFGCAGASAWVTPLHDRFMQKKWFPNCIFLNNKSHASMR